MTRRALGLAAIPLLVAALWGMTSGLPEEAGRDGRPEPSRSHSPTPLVAPATDAGFAGRPGEATVEGRGGHHRRREVPPSTAPHPRVMDATPAPTPQPEPLELSTPEVAPTAISTPQVSVTGPSLQSGALTEAELRALALDAGWPEHRLPEVVSVADCESTLRPGETGSQGEAGLLQIHPRWHPGKAARYDLYDPLENLIAGREVFIEAGRSWSPWSCRPVSPHREDAP